MIDLWPQLAGVPVYATPFTAEMLKSKLAEIGLVNGFPLADHPAWRPPHHRAVRRRADQHVALDPRAFRRGDQDAARRRAAYRRLETRREPADQRADRRRTAEGARRRRGRGADLRLPPMPYATASRRRKPTSRRRSRASSARRRNASRSPPSPPMSRASARWPRPRAPRAASLSWSAAPCSA